MTSHSLRWQRISRRLRVAAPGFILVGITLALGGTAPARAGLVTHEFGGVIDVAKEGFEDLLGQNFTGTLTYETDTTPEPDPNFPGFSNYPHIPPYDPAIGLNIVIGEWAARSELKVFHPTPSLAQHIGEASTLWPIGGVGGNRRADRFAGEIEDVQ